MLDDLKLIHERDKHDALGCVEKQWQQLLYRYGVELPQNQAIKNIVWCGFGYSTVAAQFMQTWLDLNVPIVNISHSNIPKFVDKSTLFIAANYDGNDSEVISAYKQAQAAAAQIIVFTGNGRLAELAKVDGYPIFELPEIKTCHSPTLFFVKAAAEALGQLFDQDKFSSALESASVKLKEQITAWRPDVATKDNLAKQAALELIGRATVVSSGPKLQPVASQLKLSLNLFAKNIAWQGQLPQANYSDYAGWHGQPLEKLYAVVNICSDLECAGIQTQINTANKLLSGKRPAAYAIEPVGNNILDQLLWGIVFSDFVAVYLAILNNVNTSPSDILDKYQSALGG